MAGHLGLPGNSVYSSNKLALIGLTEAMAQEHGPLDVRVFDVAPGACTTNGLDEAVDKRLDSGAPQLVAFSQKLRAQTGALAAQVPNERGALADPQEAADHMFACAIEGHPIHNPSGSDAEMLTNLSDQQNRQGIIDQLSAMLFPAA